MTSHFNRRTQEEQDRLAEEEEKREVRRERRDRYYGKDGNNKQYKRRPHIFLFRPEDLDNDNVISDVESTPTYKRTRQVLESLRGKASGNATTDTPPKGEEPVQGVISFA
jgi:cell division protein FtsZ